MDISPEPGGAAEPKDKLSGWWPTPQCLGAGQGLAAGKPGQAPGCFFLLDMLVVAAEGLVDLEQEDKVLGILQMGLLAYMLSK